MKWNLPRACFAAAVFTLTIFPARVQQPAEQNAKQPAPNAGAKDAKPAPRKKLPPVLPGFEAGTPRREAKVVAGSRGSAPPEALAPSLGKLYGGNPIFAWKSDGKSQSYVVTVYDEDQQEIFHAQVYASSFRYPPDAPRLEPGKTYYWTVAAHSPVVGDAFSPPQGIVVVSAATAKEIERRLAEVSSSGDYEAALERARVLVEYRLWYDVLAAYNDLIARYPDRAELYEDRGTVYAQLDVTKALAERDLKHAAELSHRNHSRPWSRPQRFTPRVARVPSDALAGPQAPREPPRAGFPKPWLACRA